METFFGYKTTFITKDYIKFKEVYNVSQLCKEKDDYESCVHFAHAVAYLPFLISKMNVAEKITRAMCEDKQYAFGCLVLGDILSDYSKNIEQTDQIRETADAYQTACILGSPKGCGKYADLCTKYNGDNNNERSILWNMVSLQLAQQRLNEPEEPIEVEEEEDTEIDEMTQRMAGKYRIPDLSTDTIADTHLEAARAIANILTLDSDATDFPLIDLDEILSRPLRLTDRLYQLRAGSIYRIHLANNRYKDGYQLSDEIINSDDDGNPIVPKFYAKLMAIPSDLPQKTSHSISREKLEQQQREHFNTALERYEKACEESNEGEENTCLQLGLLWKDFYVLEKKKDYLVESVSACKKGCSKKQLDCCIELGDLYSTAYLAEDTEEEIKRFNHQRAKYYYYQACSENPLHCFQFANVLREEGDKENALKIIHHACKVGGNKKACHVMAIERKRARDEETMVTKVKNEFSKLTETGEKKE